MKRHLLEGLVPAVLALGLLAAAPAPTARVDSLISRARAAAAKGKLNDAFMLMQSAVVADPARAASYIALADLYAARRDFYFAHKYYSEALYLNPTLAAALEGAGRADLALGNRKGAQSMLERLEKSCGAHCKETADLRAALEVGKNTEADAASASLDKH